MLETDETFATIWDNDGTLVNTHTAITEGANEPLGDFGLTINDIRDPYDQDFRGTSFLSIWQEAIYQHAIPIQYEEFKARAEEAALRVLQGQASIVDAEQVRVLEELASHSVPMAVASMSDGSWTNNLLNAADLRHYFEHVITGDDVPEDRHKPDPYIFQEAARRLGVPAVRCVVFEDAPIGIEGARRAGMKKVGVTKYNRDKTSLNNADVVSDDYRDVTYESLRVLVSS